MQNNSEVLIVPLLDEILAERDAQIAKWGNQSDDTNNTPNDWVSFLAYYSTGWFANTYPPYNKDTVDAFREAMVKTAAISLAALESIDRQRAATGKTFYED